MKSVGIALLSALLATAQDFSEYVRQGRDLLAQARFMEAETLFSKAVELRPDSSKANYYLGLARLRQGRAVEAISALEQARMHSTTPNPAVLFELGNAYLQNEDYVQAEVVLRRARELVPKEVRFRLQLAWTYYKLVQGAEAKSELIEAVKLSPGNATVHFYLGLVHAALGELEAAALAFEKAMELDSASSRETASIEGEARMGLARVLSQLGRVPEATRELELVLEKFPERASTAHNELGLIALRASDWESAIRHFEAVAEADPSHRQAAYNLALLYRRQGKEQLAAEMERRFDALRQGESAEERSLARTSSRKKP